VSLRRWIAGSLLCVTVLVQWMTSVPRANAFITNNANALDVIGQYDDSLSAPSPIYTKYTAHDGPNKLGFDFNSTAAFVYLDSTNNRFFVSDFNNNRVLVYNTTSTGAFVDRIPDYVLGQANFYTFTGANTQSGMSGPRGIAFDSVNGRLFIAQTGSQRVAVYDLSDGVTSGENAIYVIGQSNFTNATQANTQAGMNNPIDVLYSTSSGARLYISQFSSNRVTVYNLDDGITTGENAIGILGQPDFTTATAGATQSTLTNAWGLALDAANKRLFVACGTFNNRILVFDVANVSNGENAINVIGQSNFTNTSTANTQAGMNAPRGLAYDAANQRLFVGTQTSNRVTVYNIADGITDGENAVRSSANPHSPLLPRPTPRRA
jgi:DNA-binding beta-propeller fold protein YncE